MDEPTNDLDLETLDLLEDLISSYEGTVIVISHDRQFIDKVATETWVFDGNGHIESIVGGWEDVERYYQKKALASDNALKSVKESKEQKKAESKPVKKTKGLTFTQKHELKELPGKIEQLETQLATLDEQLNDPALYDDDGTKAREVATNRGKVQEELDALYARWEELESIGQA